VRRLLWLALPLLAAGCALGGDDGASTIDPSELKNFVLQQKDLPRVFLRFDEGRQIGADLPSGTRSDPRRFGRVEGWKARYRRAGSPQTRGPLVIESRVDLFKPKGGAEDELDEARKEYEDGEVGWKAVGGGPELGDESLVLTLLQGNPGAGVRYYLILWRDGSLTASLLTNGFAGKLTLEQSAELARKQARRISTAAAS